MVSIVIAAHNEENVIGRCLDALRTSGGRRSRRHCRGQRLPRRNGRASGQARRTGARPPQPGKARALNAGDASAQGFPRLYLDADMNLSGADVKVLSKALQRIHRCWPAHPGGSSISKIARLRSEPILEFSSSCPFTRMASWGEGQSW